MIGGFPKGQAGLPNQKGNEIAVVRLYYHKGLRNERPCI
jgi:hypothetical protein